ncbi:glycerol-3-phosphate 1-O-acyltransferase [bacterium]|nr:MAG: acyl-phosphate glycerol 3-phosphate acyltransferase [bacterium TMED6]RCL86908.1 MAG: glycerol-3-phosphate 1-O-acyltransferase [bacterium]|tara:strand:+ start:10001 stop:10642 length:642 start_codon:yes stop_codon:yes gene_type:complete
MTLSTLLIILISYLVGSISGGVIIGKIRNVDIRQKGSKAAGATNAFRTMGALFAISVLVIDVYKGYFSVYYIPLLFLDESTNIVKALAGFSAILGHVFPLFFKFKGGKGVGTALGTLLAFPQFYFTAGIGFLTWLINLFITGFVSLGSILAGIMVSVVFIFENDFILNELSIYIIFISIFFILTHRENIKRLFNGSENQFKKIMLINLFKKND